MGKCLENEAVYVLFKLMEAAEHEPKGIYRTSQKVSQVSIGRPIYRKTHLHWENYARAQKSVIPVDFSAVCSIFMMK